MAYAYAATQGVATDTTPATWPSAWPWPDGPGGAVPPWDMGWGFPGGNAGGDDWDMDVPLPPGWDWTDFPTYS